MTTAWYFLLHNHISSSIRRAYNAGLEKFRKFRASEGNYVSTISLRNILRFIAHLYNEGIVLSTAKVYLASIGNYLEESGKSNPTAFGSVTRCLKGYARKRSTAPDHRLPITFHLSRVFRRRLCVSGHSDHDKKLYWCAIVFVFYAYLHVGAFCPSYKVFSVTASLLLCNVSVEKNI